MPKDELYQKYIVEGFSQQACAEHFNCERSVIYNNLQRYGFTKTPEQISEHRRNTCMKKYGFASPVQSPEIQERVKQNSLQKYGAPNPAQAHIEHKDILFSQEKFTEWLKSLDKKPSVYFLRDFFKTSWHAVVSRVREYGVEDLIDIAPLRSHYEDEIIDFLKKLGITNIEPNNRKILGRQEIDIYLPDYKFGIEFNGIYFHSDLSSKYQDHGGRSTRHQEKSLLAEEKGVFLFHIFEHEWDDSFLRKNENLNLKVNILNRIQTLLGLNVVTIGARKCEIREISKQDKNNFLDKNHIQGKEKHSQYAFGLYYQDELVACMTFGKSKFKKYDWELMRFCTKQGINVSGGASRLFQYFLNNYVASGETIVSYNDITKTKGTLYQTLGFELQSINRPNYWWINLDTKEVKSRYETQIPNESKVMHDAGFCRICDCGTKTWLYTKK